MLRSPWLAALFLLCGCLRPNPGFDLLEAGETDDTGTPDTPGTTGPDIGTSTTTAAPTTTGSSGFDSSTTGPGICDGDLDCGDGQFCNGVEVCAPGSPDADPLGCAPGVAPCGPDQACQEVGAVCLGACDLDADIDDDGIDGVACGGADCDDTNPEIGPGKPELCDPAGVDEDCDPATLGPDADGDGAPSYQCCNFADQGLVCGTDCDDALPGIGVGDWAHCPACGSSCAALESCVAGSCVGSRRVFVTSKQYDGALGGLAGADAKCQSRAEAAGLGGVFKAFLIDKGTGLDRLEHPATAFIRLDGVKVADDWNDLTDHALDAPLERDEFRQLAGFNAWTGSKKVNGPGIQTCENWTFKGNGCLENQKCGGGGELSQVNEHWDGFFIFDCDELFRLYCIEQG